MVDIEGTDADILSRFDFEIEELIDRDSFTKALDLKLKQRQDPTATQKQVDKFFDVFDITVTKFPDKGISTVKFDLFQKPQTRFGLKGFRGLFGIKRALKFFKTGSP